MPRIRRRRWKGRNDLPRKLPVVVGTVFVVILVAATGYLVWEYSLAPRLERLGR